MSKVLPQGMLRCLRGTTRPLVRSHSIAFHPTPSPFPTSRFASSSSSSSASSSKSGGIRATTVVLIFVPILTGILGIWQIQRLKWKVALIEEVDRNLEKEPMILPGNINMSALPDFAFRRVLLRGQFQGPPILLGPQVNTGVPGYNLILPFNRATAGGSTILLNRGFITTTRATAIRQGKEAAPGLTIDGEGTGEEVIVEGMLTKASDGGSWFTPKNDTEGNQWFWKDVVGMAAWCGGEEKGVQPVLVDAIDPSDPKDPKHPNSKYKHYDAATAHETRAIFSPAGMGKGWAGRAWDMYGVSREVWTMLRRQQLQLWSVLFAAIIIIMHVEMMVHDFTQSQIKALFTNETSDLTADEYCAYSPGTGVANWWSQSSDLAWYTMYHLEIILLCVMLAIDELANVRCGCFAPQGLGVSTLCSSPNYGIHAYVLHMYFKYSDVEARTIRLRNWFLRLVVAMGAWNILRSFLASLEFISTRDIVETYRNGRFPVRPFRGENYPDGDHKQYNFHAHVGAKPNKKQYWSERLQLQIGDQYPMLNKIGKGHPAHKHIKDTGVKAHQPDQDELRNRQGEIPRQFWHGYIIEPPHWPKLTKDEVKMMARRPKKGKTYRGLKAWRPKKDGLLLYYFDVRRVVAILGGLAMMAVHVAILLNDMPRGVKASNDYRAQYDSAFAAWKSNGGPSDTLCQFYRESTIPLVVQAGDSTWWATELTRVT
ncbi:surfeit locus 1 family protein, partial [Tremellales sp. Uapishka_1]